MTLNKGDKYIMAMKDLANAQIAYDDECREIALRCEKRIQSIKATVEQADKDVTAAESGFLAAQALVTQADRDSEEIWHTLLHHLPTRYAARAEPLPAPDTVDLDGDPDLAKSPATCVAMFLSQACEVIEHVREGREPSLGDYVALSGLGAITAIGGYSLAQGLITIGYPMDTSINLILGLAGRVLAVISPFLGLCGISCYLRRRAIRWGFGSVTTVIAAGVITVAVTVSIRT